MISDKTCKTCKESKALSEFKGIHCRECVNAKARERYAANKEVISAKILAKYHIDKTRHREYYQQNKERIKKYSEQYYKENKQDFIRNINRRRAARKQNSYEKYTNEDIFALWGMDCYICGQAINFEAPRKAGTLGWEYGLQMDHVIPIRNGGSDTVENVKPAHGLCNLKKH